MYGVWKIFTIAALVVAAIVYGLIGWCIVRYRDRGRGNELPPQFSRNNRLEIAWTVIPILIVGGLFAITYAAERHVETLDPHHELVVDVTAFRWSWRFDYPAYQISILGTPERPPQLILPVHETVRFNVTSSDVDHSFWVPEFLFKRDAIPGLENHFDWTPKTMGVFRGECGEFCGTDHALMGFTVAVVSARQFAHWTLTRKVIPAPGPEQPQ